MTLKRSMVLVFLLITAPVLASNAEDYAWFWTLQGESAAPVYRARLPVDVYSALAGDGLRELMVTDADGQPVPFAVIPEAFLIEPLARRLSLAFETATRDDENAEEGSDHKRAPLEMKLEHGDTRLVLTAPETDASSADDKLVLEALIGAPEAVPDAMTDHTLIMRFASESPMALDCRVRPIDEPEAREQSVRMSSEGDSHPYHYTGARDIRSLPAGWHLRCFGATTPPGLQLLEANLYVRGQRDHGLAHRLRPEILSADDGYHFTLSGPFRVAALEVSAEEANLLADVAVYSRADAGQPWHSRGTGVLSTLSGQDPGPARIELAAGVRQRQWRVEMTPSPARAPDITVEAPVEELLMLAQGKAPWRLYAGTYTPVESTAPRDLVEQTRQRLGQSWLWPVAVVTERSEAGGAAALVLPPEPIPWQRWILWTVLIAGAVLLVWQCVRLLRHER